MKCPPAEVNLKYVTTRHVNVNVTNVPQVSRPNCTRGNKVARDMASCEYGQIAGGICGCSADNPANVESVLIAKCTKDIRGHLRSHDVRDASVHSESNLLLARAGMCDVDEFNSLNRQALCELFYCVLHFQ